MSSADPDPVSSRSSSTIGVNVVEPRRSNRRSNERASTPARSSAARRVLPTPGAPITVTRRAADDVDGIVERAAQQRRVRRCDRRRVSRRRSSASSSSTTWNVARASALPLTRTSPSTSYDTIDRVSRQVSSPTITRPGWQAASSRAAVFSTSPTRSASSSPITNSPVLMPTRKPELDTVLIAHRVGERPEPLLQLQPGRDGSQRVVLGDLGHAEHRHHAVAGELDHGARVILDRRPQDLEVGRQRGSRRFGVDTLAERRGPDEIAEQRRHVLADRVGCRRRHVDRVLRLRRRSHRRPALVAELRARWLLRTDRSRIWPSAARRTHHRTWRSLRCRDRNHRIPCWPLPRPILACASRSWRGQAAPSVNKITDW